MNTKKIVAMLLTMVMFLGVFMSQGSWASEVEETYTLPALPNVNDVSGKMQYSKLINDLWLSELHPQDEDAEWVDDPIVWEKINSVKAEYNGEFMRAYVKNTFGVDLDFEPFTSKGLQKGFDFKNYQQRTTPLPGDIAWEGLRPWSQAFVVHSVDGGKVVAFGRDLFGVGIAFKANADRFYYFRPGINIGGGIAGRLTNDNHALMIRWSKRPLMVGHNGYFYPDRLVTRAEFAQILVNLFELDPPKVTETSFSDVKPTDWFAPAVEAVKEAGLINGTPEGKFMPREHVTYEQVAIVLSNYWRSTGLYQKKDDPGIYRNGSSDRVIHAGLQRSYAKEEVEFALRAGVMHTRYDNYQLINFADAVTRKEMARIIYHVSARGSAMKEDGTWGRFFDIENLPVFKDCEENMVRRLAVKIPD